MNILQTLDLPRDRTRTLLDSFSFALFSNTLQTWRIKPHVTQPRILDMANKTSRNSTQNFIRRFFYQCLSSRALQKFVSCPTSDATHNTGQEGSHWTFLYARCVPDKPAASPGPAASAAQPSRPWIRPSSCWPPGWTCPCPAPECSAGFRSRGCPDLLRTAPQSCKRTETRWSRNTSKTNGHSLFTESCHQSSLFWFQQKMKSFSFGSIDSSI